MLKRDINFFAVIGQDSSGFAIDFEKALKICLLIFAAIAIVIMGLLVLIAGGQKLKISSLEKSIVEMEEPLKEVQALKEESEQLQMDIETFNQSVSEFDQQARLTTEDIQKIAQCLPNGVVVNDLSYSDGTVVLNCTGDSELSIADFANALRNSQQKNPEPTSEEDFYIKDFDDVTYTGVSKDDKGKFTSSVSVLLKSRVVPEVIVEDMGEETTEGAEN